MRFKILGLCVLLMSFSVYAEATTYSTEQLLKMVDSEILQSNYLLLQYPEILNFLIAF